MQHSGGIMTKTTVSRAQQRQAVIKQYPLTYPLALIGGGLLIGILLGFRLFSSSESGYAVNLYTTLIDVGLTVGVIEVLSRRRDAQRANRERLQELITQMGSKDNGLAIAAVEILRLRGWLYDGSLQGAYLYYANLEGADLGSVHLTGANLIGAHLTGANLIGAHLEGARLGSANLQGVNLDGSHLQRTHLIGAHLEGANLGSAHLQGAHLSGAHLTGVNLGSAHLTGVNLIGAQFDEHTTLPDGTQWTPDTNMTCFTDPAHPQF
ncbi:MAG: pentapeptide repeat-containing protein [Anaerolineae bacterium]|nr:pentapeptide repeat-containing protein [Anaerolineae bacterium]